MQNQRSESRIRSIIGGSIGNLVEWYDWYAYSFFAIYFAPSFFPKSDSTAQLLNTAGIFAVGFFMRPFGSWLFGSLADRWGRKRSLTLSVLLMSFGSLLIAIIPSYHSIGIAAPALLFLARLLQGLSVGGEYGISATYLTEMADSKRKGFYSSFQYVTLIGGQLLAVAIQLLLQQIILTEAELESWGWRIPFVLGALLSLIAFYLRRNLSETPDFLQARSTTKSRGTIAGLLQYPRAVLTVVGLTLGGTVAFYTYSVYMSKFLVNTSSLTKYQSTIISFFSLLLFAGLQPLFGSLSDRIGRKPLLIAFGVCGTLFTVPLLMLLSNTVSPTGAFALIVLGLIMVSGYTSINAVVKAELFPPEVRALGVGLPYALTTALFGGTAEYIAPWFKQQGREQLFFYYVSACILISLVVYVRMKEQVPSIENKQ